MERTAVPNTIRVLIIDDDEDDAFILRRHLMSNDDYHFVVEWVDSFDDACEKIFARQHDVYLIDYRLGDKTGIDLLQLVKPGQRSESFIMMSGAGDRDLLAKSMKYEAADFIVKGTFDSELLTKAIVYSLQRKADEQKRTDHLIELNRSKDEFISIASHQLRTPATGVKQYLGLLREGFMGELTEQQQEILDKAYDSNERQLVIVNDLLRVARVDAGKVNLRPESVDIGVLVHDVIKELHSVAALRHQTMNFVREIDDARAVVDESSIRMVIENITENASKYSPEHSTITITLREHGTFIEVSVADEGVGIDEVDRERLFAKFSRIDNELSTKVGGTGLGLYWAKKMVDLHRGSLEYQPNFPRGSIFVINLPKQ